MYMYKTNIIDFLILNSKKQFRITVHINGYNVFYNIYYIV